MIQRRERFQKREKTSEHAVTLEHLADPFRVTQERLNNRKAYRYASPQSFREHLRICAKGCRLTQYSGNHHTHNLPRFKSDTGTLCPTGLALWQDPEHMREAVNPRAAFITTETTMRAMGFPSAHSYEHERH